MTKKTILGMLVAIDDAMNDAGWDCIVEDSAGSHASFKGRFQDAFRRFTNDWIEQSRLFAARYNVEDSPISAELVN